MVRLGVLLFVVYSFLINFLPQPSLLLIGLSRIADIRIVIVTDVLPWTFRFTVTGITLQPLHYPRIMHFTVVKIIAAIIYRLISAAPPPSIFSSWCS
jgi:hypothetical protein